MQYHIHTASKSSIMCTVLWFNHRVGTEVWDGSSSAGLPDLKLDKSGYNKPVCASILPGNRQNNYRVTHRMLGNDYITCRVWCTTWKLVCASILLKHKTEQAQGNQFCAWDRPVISTYIVFGTSCETCMPMSQHTSNKSLSGVWIDTASLE